MGRWATCACVLVAVGCGRSPQFEVDLAPCEEDPSTCSSTVSLLRSADILFVIDNSGSMGGEQGTLAANFPAFIDVLEGEQVGASYRIGLTTTDSRGLRATSCRERINEFEFFGLGEEMIDERLAGCLASCRHERIDLQPTTTDDDPVAAPRPWLEKVGAQTNVPVGMSITEALQCVGPQGINGFGFEAPLEAMNDVLDDRSSGFLRDDALFAVIFVTDEADCSMPPDHIDWLIGDLGRPLWSDPNGDHATSAVCWNAGVECTNGPGVYDDCVAVEKGFDGSIIESGDGILYSVDRYVDALRDLGTRRAASGGNGQVLVAVLAGVPTDYAQGGELVYQDSDDPEFNAEYGIGPGCDRGTETIISPPGIPPVRLREFAEAFATEGRNLFSICDDDYSVALEQIADAIARLGARACVPGCAVDGNPNFDGVQPRCSLVEEASDGSGTAVQPCVVIGGQWSFPNDATDLCYRALTDPDGQTESAADDMSAQCVTRGFNLEYVVERRDGVPVPAGASVRVDCELQGPIGTPCNEL